MDTATVTVRFIRSFEQRNIKLIVHHKVDLAQTGVRFLQCIMKDLHGRNGIPPPVKNYAYDTLKIQHKAYGAKSTNPVINTESGELFDLQLTLAQSGVENETEISCFQLEDYLRYKATPQTTW